MLIYTFVLKVTGVRESKNFSASYLTNFSIDLNGIWYVLRLGVWNLILIYFVHSRKKNPAYVISLKKKIELWLVFRHFQTDFFQTWNDDKRPLCSAHFDISLGDFDFLSRSQLHEKSKTLVFIFSQM